MLITSSTNNLPDYIRWHGDYHPYRIGKDKNPKFDKFSGNILQLKDATPFGIAFFSKAIESTIPKEAVVVCIPSSDPGNISTGIRALTIELAKSGRIDGNGCLVRILKLQKKAHGGARNYRLEKLSLKVENVELIKGKDVVLLDDVVTTGTSFKAARELLLENGAKSVNCFALGRTNWD
jgi:predicted amidophosphoribosyltransferase